jgi:hypothetical protein
LIIWNIDYYYGDGVDEYDDDDDYNWFANSSFANHDTLESYYWWQQAEKWESSGSGDYDTIFREFEDILRRRSTIEQR